jgi:hypothetical protein
MLFLSSGPVKHSDLRTNCRMGSSLESLRDDAIMLAGLEDSRSMGPNDHGSRAASHGLPTLLPPSHTALRKHTIRPRPRRLSF